MEGNNDAIFTGRGVKLQRTLPGMGLMISFTCGALRCEATRGDAPTNAVFPSFERQKSMGVPQQMQYFYHLRDKSQWGVPQQMQYFHHLRDKSQWGGAPTNAIFLSFERQKSMFTGIGYCQAQSKP